jgi:molybdenum-dependent DNA-binding transcriptional regulator ModE
MNEIKEVEKTKQFPVTKRKAELLEAIKEIDWKRGRKFSRLDLLYLNEKFAEHKADKEIWRQRLTRALSIDENEQKPIFKKMKQLIESIQSKGFLLEEISKAIDTSYNCVCDYLRGYQEWPKDVIKKIKKLHTDLCDEDKSAVIKKEETTPIQEELKLEKTERKIIQISKGDDQLVVLCDDGSLWKIPTKRRMVEGGKMEWFPWSKMPDVPQE